jgi:hypothetical protein
VKYTTHTLPMAELEPNRKTSGEKFGDSGQERALERGDFVDTLQPDPLQPEQNSSQNELEQELLSHTDRVVDEFYESSSASTHITRPSDKSIPSLAAKNAAAPQDTNLGVPEGSLED